MCGLLFFKPIKGRSNEKLLAGVHSHPPMTCDGSSSSGKRACAAARAAEASPCLAPDSWISSRNFHASGMAIPVFSKSCDAWGDSITAIIAPELSINHYR